MRKRKRGKAANFAIAPTLVKSGFGTPIVRNMLMDKPLARWCGIRKVCALSHAEWWETGLRAGDLSMVLKDFPHPAGKCLDLPEGGNGLLVQLLLAQE